MYDLRHLCDKCGGEPPRYQEGDVACAVHGDRLKSEADLAEEEREAEAEARRDRLDLAAHIFDLGCAMNRAGVARW
jgi:uncharacterized Zn finger protein (UPF0148 family)